MQKELIDMHVHTRFSDGKYKLEEVLALAHEKGIKKLVITDHDTIIKTKDISTLASKYDISVIPGIEISTSEKKLHILGYNISDIELLETELLNYKRRNYFICLELIELLKSNGFDISVEEVKDNIRREGSSLLDKREIVKVLIKKGYASNVKEAYDNIIGRKAKYYIPISKITPSDAISLIISAGGLPVLAHPASLKLSKEELYYKVFDLMKSGLSGIEVVNGITPNRSDYEEVADTLGLLKTYGSDFHDESHTLGLLEDPKVWYDIISKSKNKVYVKENYGIKQG